MRQLDARYVYANLLLQLHQLIKEGKGEGQEANDVRDKMDEPYRQLSEEAREVFSFVSQNIDDLEGIVWKS